MENTSVVVQN